MTVHCKVFRVTNGVFIAINALPYGIVLLVEKNFATIIYSNVSTALLCYARAALVNVKAQVNLLDCDPPVFLLMTRSQLNGNMIY